MDEIKAKQQVVEKIKESSKILVTVSKDPSVDALSAALGLALMLDKQGKYPTAIFSGHTPPAIAFLEPEKTFDDTTDSLRDFIIALNKEKADHLRYKVEGEAVKIFITPYKTTITEKDLEFSQGDYNVELVIALGVNNQADLDSALANHGQILHDASIITMTAGDQTSNLGGTDWHDSNSSGLSEMVAGLAEAMKDDKKQSLLDGPIATALLTGIVAETDRFSNEHTTSKTLTVAATLMNAGADQQLIVSELLAAQSAAEVSTPEDTQPVSESKDASVLSIAHEGETLADLDRRVLGEDEAKERVIDEVEAAQSKAAVEESDIHSAYSATVESPVVGDISTPVVETKSLAQPEIEGVEPALGGTLNATAEQAAEDARREAENDQNRTILSHAYLDGGDSTAEPVAVEAEPLPATDSAPHSAYALDSDGVMQPPQMPQPTQLPQPPQPTDFGLPMPPPIPDFSQFPAGPEPALPLPPTQQPEILGDILAPEPLQPPIPPVAIEPSGAYGPVPEPAPEPAPTVADPGQFQIPSQ